MRWILIVTFLAGTLSCGKKGNSETPQNEELRKQIAFPGADGGGKFTSGGRGGKVLFVDNLNDTGQGSLREAIDQKGKRIIIFRISGTIHLKSELEIKNGDLTIAGQTAPGDGICLADYSMFVKASNVIIRYMRFRLGDAAGKQMDALEGRDAENVIVDHCSISWSIDESATFYRMKDFTLQWCIISESLNNSVHEKGEHGYGGIWGGTNASYHHNLLAHHTSRNPRFNGNRLGQHQEVVDFRNNVIYNWRDNSSYGGEDGKYNMVANYYKPGPATKEKVRSRIMNPYAPYGKFYMTDNFAVGNENISDDNWAGGLEPNEEGVDLKGLKASEPFMVTELEHQTGAQKAYKEVLEKAGASFHRDEIDTRIIEEVKEGTAHFGENGIINTQKDVNSWPVLKSTTPDADSDMDGMPDAWEKQKGLNPEDLSDGKEYKINQDYTNIEVYLNEILNEQK